MHFAAKIPIVHTICKYYDYIYLQTNWFIIIKGMIFLNCRKETMNILKQNVLILKAALQLVKVFLIQTLL